MEADHDEAYMSTAIHADESASADLYDLEATKWLVPAALVLFAMMLLEIVVLLAWRNNGNDFGMFIRFGQAGIAGFYLACGWAKWWARCLVAAGTTATLVITLVEPTGLFSFILFGVIVVMSAGFTYLVRMIVAVVRGESSPTKRFTIFGLMVVTAIIALVAVLMSRAPELADTSFATTLVLFSSLIALTLAAQCSPLWGTTTRQVVTFFAGGVSLAVILPFVYLGLMFGLEDRLPDTLKTAFDFSVMIFTTWVTLYPLVFVFYGMGGSLVDPSWKLKPRHHRPAMPARAKAEVDVLMVDHDDRT